MNSTATSQDYRIVVLGSGAVGKSAISISYIMCSFAEAYDPTIEDSYTKQTVVDGETVRLDLLDTAGQEEYSAMRDQYMRTGQGFILVYSSTCRTSFDELESFAEQISRVQDKSVERIPIVVVANKVDLAQERQVTSGEGKAFADKIGAEFIETSAKLRFNIDETFATTVRAIKNANLNSVAAKVARPTVTSDIVQKKKASSPKRVLRKLLKVVFRR